MYAIPSTIAAIVMKSAEDVKKCLEIKGLDRSFGAHVEALRYSMSLAIGVVPSRDRGSPAYQGGRGSGLAV